VVAMKKTALLWRSYGHAPMPSWSAQERYARTPDIFGRLNLFIRPWRSNSLTFAHGWGRSPHIRILPGQDVLRPEDIASALYGEYGVKLLLHEGGPTSFSSFLTSRLVDELFLTVAPHIVGSGLLRERPSLAAAVHFAPEEAIQGSLVSVKRPDSGNHLYLRYRLANALVAGSRQH